MAKIVKSDSAPEGPVKVSVGSISFEVPYETDDLDVIAFAEENEYLTVEHDKPVEVPAPVPRNSATEPPRSAVAGSPKNGDNE